MSKLNVVDLELNKFRPLAANFFNTVQLDGAQDAKGWKKPYHRHIIITSC